LFCDDYVNLAFFDGGWMDYICKKKTFSKKGGNGVTNFQIAPPETDPKKSAFKLSDL
jgi:hypothetical protein